MWQPFDLRAQPLTTQPLVRYKMLSHIIREKGTMMNLEPCAAFDTVVDAAKLLI